MATALQLAARPVRNEASNSPLVEARMLHRMVKHGGETAASIRALIGMGNGYRRKVRAYFDAMVDPEGRVLQLLRAGWSHQRIRSTLHVRWRIIFQLSKQIHAPTLKAQGRGRRLTRELYDRLAAAVSSGQRPCEIERALRIDPTTVLRYRREHGDFVDRRHWQLLTTEEIAEAEQLLRHGEAWRDVAKWLGCSLATLQRRVVYRKRRRPDECAQTYTAAARGARGASTCLRTPGNAAPGYFESAALAVPNRAAVETKDRPGTAAQRREVSAATH
jgi:hypothetical protein